MNNVSLTSTLDDLLEISIEGLPLSSLSADSAIDLWWSDCRTTRRTNQTKRRPYRPRSSTPTATSLTSTTGGESQELDDLTFDSRDCSESDSSSEETALSTIGITCFYCCPPHCSSHIIDSDITRTFTYSRGQKKVSITYRTVNVL